MVTSLVLAAALAAPVALNPYASVADLQQAYAARRTTTEAVVAATLARISALDRAGPRLNSIIALNPKALDAARTQDALRALGRRMGPLAGAPVLIKDNIETADGTATTAGSLALAGNVTGRDAPLVRRLRSAGAVILGKTNLSEWANFRSAKSVSGWSAVGGLTRNPYVLDRSACGSSSGSAAAVAAGFATIAIGTETDGSITCPAAANGVVGLKPTLGLVSRSRVVPISPEQDTPGPIGREVADVAAALAAIAGTDPADPATREADANRSDYVAALKPDALRGVRIGVLRGQVRGGAADPAFDQALATLARAGAVLVELEPPRKSAMEALAGAETAALRSEFKTAIAAYLATAAPAVGPRDLDQLIAFDAQTPAEIALFGQDTFEAAAAGPSLEPAKSAAGRATARRLAVTELDRMFATGGVAAIVAETGAPAPVVDLANGTASFGSPSTLPAVAGYPHLTVPMGQVGGLPVGLSLIGPRWSEARLLAYGYAFEQAAKLQLRPRFLPSVAMEPRFAAALDPQ